MISATFLSNQTLGIRFESVEATAHQPSLLRSAVLSIFVNLTLTPELQIGQPSISRTVTVIYVEHSLPSVLTLVEYLQVRLLEVDYIGLTLLYKFNALFITHIILYLAEMDLTAIYLESLLLKYITIRPHFLAIGSAVTGRLERE